MTYWQSWHMTVWLSKMTFKKKNLKNFQLFMHLTRESWQTEIRQVYSSFKIVVRLPKPFLRILTSYAPHKGNFQPFFIHTPPPPPFFIYTLLASTTYYPLASEPSREVANLTERKNLHTPVNSVREFFLSTFLPNFSLCQDRWYSDVPPHLAQPCCVALGRTRDSGHFVHFYSLWFVLEMNLKSLFEHDWMNNYQ